jgi:outer membrane lipoprotein SlyB
METVTAIFTSPEGARRAAERLRAAGVPAEHIICLWPGTSGREVERKVPTEDAEQPGLGAAVGGAVGGAVGLATASLVLPGVGPIVVAGLLAAGIAGATAGGVIGDNVEEALTRGLPRDELPLYKAALRRGKSVVVITAADDDEAERARSTLRAANAESVDAARDDWMVGLRDTEA